MKYNTQAAERCRSLPPALGRATLIADPLFEGDTLVDSCVPSKAKLRRRWFAMLLALLMAADILLIRHLGGRHPVETWLALQAFVLWPARYFALVYPVTRKWRGALVVVLVGMLFGSLALPANLKVWWKYVDMLRWVVAATFGAAELRLLMTLARSIRTILASERPDEEVDIVVQKILGNNVSARLMAAELRMWMYLFFRKRLAGRRFRGTVHFTIDRHEGNASNQVGFLFLIAVETPIAHALLALYDGTVALVASIVSVYGFCWLLAEYRATSARPVSLDDDFLFIRYGLLGNETIPLSDIIDVERTNRIFRRQAGLLRRVPAAGTANLLIYLRPGTTVQTCFGENAYAMIALAVDEPDRFITSLKAELPSSSAADSRHR